MALHLLPELDSHCPPCYLQTLILRWRNVPDSSSRLLQCRSYQFPPSARPLTPFYLRILCLESPMLYLCSCKSSTVLFTKNPWAWLYETSEVVHPYPGPLYSSNASAGILFSRLSTPCVTHPTMEPVAFLNHLRALLMPYLFFTASATAARTAVFSEVLCDADWRVLNSF